MLRALTRIVALALALAFSTSFWPTVVVPNFPDLTIKTRETFPNNVTFRTNWYFRGPRQRMEQKLESPPHTATVILTQCDRGSDFILDAQKKTYLTQPVDEIVSGDPRKTPDRFGDTVDVTVTTDSVDTGERRQVGSYQARRVKTTVTVDSNEDAGVQGSRMEIDGWYIDLPGWNCRNDSGQQPGMILGSVGRHRPHYVFRQLGAARQGFAIERTIVSPQAGVTNVNRTELVELSEAPLDASLFEVPADYTRVTRLPVP